MKQKLREEALARQLLSEQEVLPLANLVYTYPIDASKLPPVPPSSTSVSGRPSASRYQSTKALTQIRKENTEIEEKMFEIELKMRQQQELIKQGREKILSHGYDLEGLLAKVLS